MTPEQALKLLDQVCASVNLPRKDHAVVQEAVTIIEAALPKPDPDKPAKD